MTTRKPLPTAKVTNCYLLNVRESANASSSSTITQVLKKNQTVTVLKTLSNGWAQVSVNGKTGYVNARYLTKPVAPPAPKPKPKPKPVAKPKPKPTPPRKPAPKPSKPKPKPVPPKPKPVVRSKTMKPTAVTKATLSLYDRPSEKLTFQYNPSRIEDSRAPNWSAIDIPGMSHPKYQFVSGGERKVTFTLEFFRMTTKLDEVQKKIRFLQSLTYPQFDGNRTTLTEAPPIVVFNYGQYYKNFRAIVTDVKVLTEKMYDPVTLQPLYASVSIELTEYLTSGTSQQRKDLWTRWG